MKSALLVKRLGVHGNIMHIHPHPVLAQQIENTTPINAQWQLHHKQMISGIAVIGYVLPFNRQVYKGSDTGDERRERRALYSSNCK